MPAAASPALRIGRRVGLTALGHAPSRRAAGQRRAPAARALDVLILDAETRQSLVCMRSLGRAGLRVGALAASRGAPALWSRFSTVTGDVPVVERDPEGLLRMVAERTAAHRPKVVVTTHDATIEALRAHRAMLAPARLALAAEPALSLATSKADTLAIARRLGIDAPDTIRVDREQDARDAVGGAPLPMVVKPVSSWLPVGRMRVGASVAATRAAALELVGTIVGGGGSALLQPWLPGRREAVSLLFAHDEVWARFAQVAHRMYPPVGGSSVLRESIALPLDIGDAAEALVRAMHLDGYAEIEFRRDARRRPMLMEINPRLSASLEVAVRAGVDFPALLYAWAAGEPLRRIESYRHGVRMRWLGGDVKWLRDVLRDRGLPDAPPRLESLRAFAAASVRPAGYDYLDRGDPGPVLAAAGTPVLRAVRACARERLA